MFTIFLALNIFHFFSTSLCQLQSIESPTCGRIQPYWLDESTENPNPDIDNAAPVFGGREVQGHQMPWIVWIQVDARRGNKKEKHSCTGSIINTEWVITAAHCVYVNFTEDVFELVNPDELFLKAGAYKRPPSPQTRFHYSLLASQVFPDPRYVPGVEDFDVALIQLAEPLTFIIDFRTGIYEINSVCLPRGPPDLGFFHTLAGFGMIGDDPNRNWLLTSIRYQLYPYDECYEWTSLFVQNWVNENIDEEHDIAWELPDLPELDADDFQNVVCTPIDRRQICGGDSGGPVTYVRPDGRVEQTGVNAAGFETFLDGDFQAQGQEWVYNAIKREYPCGHASLVELIHNRTEWILSVVNPTWYQRNRRLVGWSAVGAIGVLGGLAAGQLAERFGPANQG